MVQPLWIASAALAVFAFAGIAVAHYADWAAPMLIFGPILIALAIVIGMIAGGIRNPAVLVISFFVIEVLFIGVDAYNWLGLRGVL